MRRVSEDRIKGCLIGGAAGDALGYPVEFMKLQSIREKYGKKGITEYSVDQNTKKALVSDDTQMTLFTAEGIMTAMQAGIRIPACRKIYPYVHCAYIDWYETQSLEPCKKPLKDAPKSWLMDIPELFARRAPGHTCISALGSLKKRDLYKPINNSKGCGGIMRAAPVGLLYPDATLEEIVEMGAEISAITHGHPLGCFPSGIFAAIVQQACYMSDHDKNGRDNQELLAGLIDRAVTAARNLYGKSDLWEEMEELINRAISFASNDKSDEVNLKELGEGWVAEETLAIALYCSLKYADDFSQALIAAVNHDGDSDSTGSVTGNILGAIAGYEAMPNKWKQNLEVQEVISIVSEEISEYAAS